MVISMYVATLASIILLTLKRGKIEGKALFLEKELIDLTKNEKEEK